MSISIRPYQQKAIDMLYEWITNNDGNPCVVMPTGSGKSIVIAALCKDVLNKWPDTRVLMLTHVRELIEQNAQKLRALWPNAPLGVYSSGMNRRELGNPITFGGIQSLRNKAAMIGHVDIAIIDECDLISHKDEGGYRTLLAALQQINPQLRIIGLTATPYRLGHGLITDAPAIFNTLIEPVSIKELIDQGFLSILRSKLTETTLNVEGVHRRGGDFIESELQAAVDTDDQNTAVVKEVIEKAAGRKHWLFFCAGVKHAEHICALLNSSNINAALVTGETPKSERDRIIAEFKAGKIMALTNANVLTVGTDLPNVDLLVMLRPTESARLYVQMAGRGMRPKTHTDYCLVMDFAGNVSRHGPIVHVQPPAKGGDGEGAAPIKCCPQCMELVSASLKQCDACGYEFPPPERPKLHLRQDDIMGYDSRIIKIKSWLWLSHESSKDGKRMLLVRYYPHNYEKRIDEYICINHGGYAGQKALQTLTQIAAACNVKLKNISNYRYGQDGAISIDMILDVFSLSPPAPSSIEVAKEGKWDRVISRTWAPICKAPAEEFESEIPF